jgi:flavin reductase (DIM6/NTAB) family NADH-FMN oxidoreductase RutF
MSTSTAQLRHALGHVAAGVAVVTSVASDGEPVGTTASAVSAVSLDPPLILVCLDRSSQTLGAVRDSGGFAINVLAEEQRPLSENFARRGRAVDWHHVEHQFSPEGRPDLIGVLAVLHCSVHDRLDGGDHEIVVGRINTLEVGPEAGRPLLHFRGAYASLGSG